MSFTSSPPVLVPSNHSLYTPSYPTDILVPIKCQELDLEPSVPLSQKSLLHGSLSKSTSPVSRDPIQYQKLKMNYLRKLNVIPIVSQKDILSVLGKEQTKPGSSKKTPKKKSPEKASKLKNPKRGSDSSSFVPSFLPSFTTPSKPIAIPPRSNSRKIPPLMDPSD